ncbi:hypothetical protein EMPS_04912 [Entomortierella parvispora]|uniref:Mixed lineage kinase domain-containing protein n=1 Tax=Entomortierella parvispora TaxID=205924 RepID=A0A9P3H9A2_9FUNG|nr:hypothetical protein EMPS_04912 [Entomortierella parvispora]
MPEESDPSVGSTPPPHSTLERVQTSLKRGSDEPRNNNVVVRALTTTGNYAYEASEKVIAATETASKGLETVKKVLGDSDNPVLNNMIQLADRLVDVGKSVPFISPAFVVLKIIIDIERKAREADEKCQDLMERINFMISHVLVLEKMQTTASLMETLSTVLQRVQDALKEAASLIEAYRKQSKIARRLKMSNTQNFENMADKIKSCSSDLMLSLQIQQTGDLSVLKRSVPRDIVAESFVKENGGQDVINSNPELVKEFAEKMHLAMSDQVMEQMQSNLQSLMAQTQSQIEAAIRESSGTGIADTIKAIANQQREWEASRKLTCVQCEKEYNVSLNGPESCGFHAGVGSLDHYLCCTQSSPCQQGYHQPEHHSKYPYGNFFPFSYSILYPQDTIENWANLKDIDLEDEEKHQQARVGQLVRWRTWGDLETKPLLVVTIGRVMSGDSYYLEIFDVAALEEARRKVNQTGQTRIFRNAPEEETRSFSMGEWILDPETDQLTGIRLTVKSTTSLTPTICIVPVDPTILKMPPNKRPLFLSKSDWEIFKPDSVYELPETLQLGPAMRETRIREPRAFKTKWSTNKVPLTLLVASEMVANNNAMIANKEVDRFVGLWRGLNPSTNPIIIMSAKAEYRLVGDKDYKPVKTLGYWKETKFPLTIKPAEAVDIPFEFTVDKTPEMIARKQVAVNFAHLTVHRPLRVRITLTDIDGNTISLVDEYVHSPRGFQPRGDTDLGFFFVDDVDNCSRIVVRFKPPTDPKKHIITITPGWSMSLHLSEYDLNKIVYKAKKTGVTQAEMDLGYTDLGLSWKVWALVDLSCSRVYGFKVLVYHGQTFPVKFAASLGYARCPIYGPNDMETRSIRYAEETEIVASIAPSTPPTVIEDDPYDDDIPTPPAVPEQGAQVVAPAPPTSAAPSPPAPTASPSVVALASPIAPIVVSSGPPSTPTPAKTAETNTQAAVATSPSAVVSTETAASGQPLSSAPSAVENGTVSHAVLDILNAKIASLEARLAASERQDALMNMILALEQKLEAVTSTATNNSSSSSSSGASDDRLSALESRLASMDQKMDSMNINLRLLDGNASRLATSLEKIAGLLST